jgi:Flp pilus assembly protein TadG
VTALARNQRGATYVEFLVVVVPFFMFVMCVLQSALLEFADLAVERAASAAARSAVVVLDDDPKFYGGEPREAVVPGGARDAVIRRGAANVLAALPAGVGADKSSQLTVTFSRGAGAAQQTSSFDPAAPVTVRVAYLFRCGVPLARRIMCHHAGSGAESGENFARFEREATLPNQGARYSYGGAK